MSRRRESSASSRSAVRPWDSTPVVGKETGLPLIQCNSCGQERTVELRAWTDANYGRVFFKCPRYETGPRARCDFYYWQKDYLAKLVQLGRITVHPEEQEGCSSEQHGNSRANPVGNRNFEAKIDVLVRTVKVLVCVLCVGVVVGILYLIK